MERLNFYHDRNLLKYTAKRKMFCSKSTLIYDAAKRLYNFAANRLHYAAKQLVAKRPDTIY